MAPKTKYRKTAIYLILFFIIIGFTLYMLVPLDHPYFHCYYHGSPPILCLMPYSMNAEGQVSFHIYANKTYYNARFACIINTNTPSTYTYAYANSLGLQNNTLMPNPQNITISNLQCYDPNGMSLDSNRTSLSGTTYHAYIWANYTLNSTENVNFTNALIGFFEVNPT